MWKIKQKYFIKIICILIVEELIFKGYCLDSNI